MDQKIHINTWKSPFGELKLAADDEKLYMCDWLYRAMRVQIDKRVLSGFVEVIDRKNEWIEKAMIQIEEYSRGERRAFDLPLGVIGTEFQINVWNELLRIPYGKTMSYQDLSIRLQNKEAIRAVAAANGANAISILIPCHRIIGSHGDLVGYAGGLPLKKRLLGIEGSYSQLSLF